MIKKVYLDRFSTLAPAWWCICARKGCGTHQELICYSSFFRSVVTYKLPGHRDFREYSPLLGFDHFSNIVGFSIIGGKLRIWLFLL